MNQYLKNKMRSKCNGCGICTFVCPKKCITMKDDGGGFLYPIIDKEKCIRCGRCEKICSNINNGKYPINTIAMTNKSEENLNKSSSGGFYIILANYVIQRGGVVFGVEMNENKIVQHNYAENIKEAEKFCGSKYVRSKLNKDIFTKVKQFLEEGKEVLFTGTPCQNNALKIFLGKEYSKLYLCDIICHSNPSQKILKMYISNLEQIKGKKVNKILFRSKENGWKNQTPIIEYEDGVKEEENTYFKSFLSELISRESCYNCVFADEKRISDFTIGDLWGKKEINVQIDKENKGTSFVTINSEKGMKIFDEIKQEMIYEQIDLKKAMSFNHYSNVEKNLNYNKFFNRIKNKKITENNIIKYLEKYSNYNKYQKIKIRIKRRLKRILKFRY